MSDRIQINYIYRNIRSGYYSIHKVFRPVEESLAVAHDVRHMETPCFRANPWSVLVNMLWMFFHRKRHVVFHVTGAFGYLVLPLWGCLTVLTVHDLSTLQIEGRKWKKAYLDHEAMGERPSIFYCSVCNQCIAYPVNYCPSCGADMRGEQNED